MKLRVARKVFGTWGFPGHGTRLGTFLEAKRITDRRVRQKLVRTRAAGLLLGFDLALGTRQGRQH